jgi:hypothetical protein
MPILDCKPNACSALPERKWTVSRLPDNWILGDLTCVELRCDAVV